MSADLQIALFFFTVCIGIAVWDAWDFMRHLNRVNRHEDER